MFFVLTVFFVALYPRVGASQGTVGARTLILSDTLGHTVQIIPPRTSAPGMWVYEIPDTRLPKGSGFHGSQTQQAAIDVEPFITFAQGSTRLTDNRILTAGSGISLTNPGTDNSALTVANTGVLSLSGTANQISVSASAGAVTLSLPQNIHTGATPQFTNVNLTGIPGSSAFNNIVVSGGGALQTRTVASLGLVTNNEPILTFASDNGSLTNNRVVSSGTGISINTGIGDGAAFTIGNTGVLSVSGTGGQVNVSSATGSITFSLPQDIHTAATPIFSGMTLTGLTIGLPSDQLVVSSGGMLKAVSISSLGLVSNSEPFITFGTNNGSINNSRVLAAGTGISISNDGVNNGNITIGNTGVTSVGLSLPAIFNVTTSTVTTTGTLTAGFSNQTAATFFAAPFAADGAPSFRALTTDDFQNIVWTVDGNADISGKFIGSRAGSFDPLDLRVNGTTRLLLNNNSSIQRDAGGFFRGFYAVDMQTLRNTSNHVASGNSSTIAGGRDNRASAAGATVGGGGYDGDQVRGNLATAVATTIAGGHGNEASVDYSSIGGGDFNATMGYAAAISGGQFNIASDYGSAITGGIQNSAIGESAFVGGGTQNNATYTKTVVVGGNLNTASGAFAVLIGGENNTAGGDSSTLGGGRYNSSSGLASVVAGGAKNTASAVHAVVGGGNSNTALSNSSTVAGGEHNSVSANFAAIAGGSDNSAAAIYSSITGGYRASTTKYGEIAHANGSFATRGDAQRSEYVLRSTTSDSNLTELFLDGAALRLAIPTNSAWTFLAHITGLASNGDAAAYEITGLVKNISGTTSIVGNLQITTIAEDIASWDVTAVADNTNDALVLKVKGALSTNIRWVASVRSTQVTY